MMSDDWIKDTLYSNGVMKNKLKIKNEKELEAKELLLSAKNSIILLKQKPKIKSINNLKKVHQTLFGELYDWAGEYRPGNFQKGGFEFFDHTRFGFAEKNINNIMKRQPQSSLKAEDYAELLDEINFMHPFREGNGRSTKVFLLAYAANHNQTIDYPRKNDEMIQAQNDADIKHIAKLIKVENTPSKDAAFKLLQQQYEKQTKKLSQKELAAQFAAQQQEKKQNGLELE